MRVKRCGVTMSLKRDIRPPDSLGSRIAKILGFLTVLWVAFTVCQDPYDRSFDPPSTFDLALWRLQHGIKSIVSSTENSVRESNESMQDTIDGRNKLNDQRIKRDVKH